MKGDAQHSYQWQSDDSGNLITLDPSLACQRVTQSACAKLKSDWGENIRIYVIKYRKQLSCKRMPFWADTNTTITFDYSYLNSCAGAGNVASTSETPYMYDVENEDDLKSALSVIATNIKSFAGYEAAKNVD
jgi:hypothetical protein